MAATVRPLTAEQVETFQRDGALVVKPFYDRETRIETIPSSRTVYLELNPRSARKIIGDIEV